MLGIPLPGDAGMQPEGFSVPETGPKNFIGRGANEYEETKGRLWNDAGAGMCPFMIK